MVIIEQENKRSRLDIQDYNGSSEEDIITGGSSQSGSKDHLFNFQRKQSNHGYTSGKTLSYTGDCNNNLIISTYESNILKNEGRLILIEEGYLENYVNENLSENIKQFLSFEAFVLQLLQCVYH